MRLVLVLMFLFVYSVGANQENKFNDLSYFSGKELTKVTLASAIIKSGVKHPDIVFKQAMYETGHLKSKLCKKHNNLFGMKKARRRISTSVGITKSGYAVYSEWVESVYDYRLWQNYMKFDDTDYHSQLSKKRYSTNSAYSKKLKSIVVPKELKNLFNKI